MSTLLHWEEGLFLQQHHFQRFQRATQESFHIERKLSNPFPYGLIHFELDENAFQNRKLVIRRLRAVLENGLYVDTETNLRIEEKDLRGVTGTRMVYLAVPSYQPDRANAVDYSERGRSNVKVLYLAEERTYPDENTGQNPQPVRQRFINARLCLGGIDDMQHMEAIPVLKILTEAGQQLSRYERDKTYAPPCFTIFGNADLKSICQKVLDMVESVRNRTGAAVDDKKTSSDKDAESGLALLELKLRFGLLNRYWVRLEALNKIENATPYAFYVTLKEFFGELTALDARTNSWGSIMDYDHQDPLASLGPLARRIEQELENEETRDVIKLPFVREVDHYHVEFTQEHFSEPEAYFLGVKSRMDKEQLIDLVTDIDTFHFVRYTWKGRSRRGVKLVYEQLPPSVLLKERGDDITFFRIIHGTGGSDHWQRIQQDGRAVIEWTNISRSDFDLTIYMTLPN